MCAHSGKICVEYEHECIAHRSHIYSAKLSLAIEKVLKPLLGAGGKYDGKVKAIVRLHVQPWHASSTLTHEAALAVC
jgi:hypothetical protein